MSAIAIRAENLSKRYRIGLREKAYDTLGGALANFVTRPVKNLRRLRRLSTFADDGHASRDVIWALKDLSFEIEAGETVGIIGPNGAGKTTLLKLLSGITHPTTGRAQVHGRVASLLEVGTGFHQELTGRENTYLNGAILGMTKKEIYRKFDEIVEFAGVEKFIDTPVKRYSSGMQVRLAFAVAAHLEPEILLVDEVLAVGDATFQKKCLGKMGDVASEGRTVLFVSHNLAAVSALCSRSILLQEGRCAMNGPTRQVIESYLSAMDRLASVDLGARQDRTGSGKIRLVGLSIADGNGRPVDQVPSGSPTSFRIDYEVRDPDGTTPLVVQIDVADLYGANLFTLVTHITGQDFQEIPERGVLVCKVEKLPLLPGTYRLNVLCAALGANIDSVQNAAELSVVPGDFFGTGKLPTSNYGSVMVEHSWELERNSATNSRPGHLDSLESTHE